MHELLLLTLEQPVHRNAGPLGDHAGHVLGRNLLFEHLVLFLDLGQAGVGRLQLLLQLDDAAVADLRHLAQFTGALGPLLLHVGLVDPGLDVADGLDDVLLQGPLPFHALEVFVQVGQLLAHPGEPLSRSRILLLLERLLLDLELDLAAFELIDLGGHAVDLDAQPRGRLVDQVDGLVRQEPVGDVAAGQGDRGHRSRVLDAHAVVHLVLLLDAAEDGDGVLLARLLHQHRLEAALQGGVLLDVLAVLVQGGGAHTVQLAAGERRFEHVRGVHGPLGRAGADQGVDLVDEQDDLTGPLLHLLEHRLEPVLKLAAVLGTGHERTEIQGNHLLAVEGGGHVAVDDALRQSLDDGGLAHAGLADEHRVVLGAAGEHLDDAADLLVPTDHRVELAAAGHIGEVAGVLLQGLIFFLRIRVGHPLVAAHTHQRLEKGVAGHADFREHGGDPERPVGEDGQEQVFLADILVLHVGRGLEALFEQGAELLGGVALAGARAADLGQGGDELVGLAEHHARGDAHLLQHRNHDPLGLFEDRLDQMLGLQFLVAARLRQLLRGLNGFLGFEGEFVELHIFSPCLSALRWCSFRACLLGEENKNKTDRVKILAHTGKDFPAGAETKQPPCRSSTRGLLTDDADPLQPQEPPHEPELQLPPPRGLAAVMENPER